MITAGIATIPSRVSILPKVLNSIKNEVDSIVLVLNGYTEIPSFLSDYTNLTVKIADNSRGDAMKFYIAGRVDEGYYLAWDDDLIMPQGCAKYLVDGVDRYNALVSLHGRIYKPPVMSFKQWAGNYRCLGTVTEDTYINFVGSGVCCYNTKRLKVSLSDFKLPNMSDIWLSKLAHDQGVPIVVLKHRSDYLTYLHPKDTIWSSTKDYSEHTRILRTFIK